MQRRLEFSAVNQFHSGTAHGDAITLDLLQIADVLRRAGFHSRIFAEHIAPGLEDRVHPIAQYTGDPSALLIVHHSMGFDAFDKVASLPDRKVLRYHNITPAEFCSDPSLKHYSEKGRMQLREYMGHVEFALADSEYNRGELKQLGYKYTAVLPILFDPEPLVRKRPTRSICRTLQGTFNFLFVGRVTPNKQQDDLVRIFHHYYQTRNSDSRLFLVGSWAGNEDYARAIQTEIAARNLKDAVFLTGAVDLSALVAYYRSSDVFVCASEHEGFCVPLLEAMTFDVPVVAFRVAAVAETLGNSGLLLDEKDPELWSEVVETLRHNSAFREEVVQRQRARLANFDLQHSTRTLLNLIHELGTALVPLENVKPTLQIQGPFETSYSLAAVNRSLALALDAEGTFDVSIHCTEGPGDYTPQEAHLTDKPRARWLWRKSELLTATPDVVLRNLYPPRVHDAQGKLNFLLFFWEDSRIPEEWARQFNASLNGVLAPSRHIEQLLRASGVTIPIYLLHPGVGQPSQVHPAFAVPLTKKSFRFLHISSGFPRKGVDVLLEAYFSEFRADDNVSLIIKTFPNIHNTVSQPLQEWQARTHQAPECIHIDQDLEAGELEGLYRQADGLVYPTRAEGFGLPIAEAMARRIPVIVTRYSGHMDFCSEENAFLLDFRLAPSRSHLNVPGAEWAEPDVQHLRELMRFVFENREGDEVRSKIDAAYRTITENFTWERTAKRAVQVLSRCMQVRLAGKSTLRLAMVTSWDARCGIAEYSRYLLDAVIRRCSGIEPVVLSSPGEGVWKDAPVPNYPCWTNQHPGDLKALCSYVFKHEFDVVHFQFNFGFFELRELGSALEDLKRAQKKVVLTLHRTADIRDNGRVLSLRQIGQSLRDVDLLLVHSTDDQERLASMGIKDNVRLFPHGTVSFPAQDARELRTAFSVPFSPVVGTFGFLLPHKGLLELLAAVGVLRKEFPTLALLAQCALHRDGTPDEFVRLVRQRIEELGLTSSVLLSTDFVDLEEAALFLQLSDILVLPYQSSAESSSAAARVALATGRPVLTTAPPIFRDVAAATFQIPSGDPRAIASAIRTVLRDQALANDLAERARKYASATSWDNLAGRYAELLDSTF